MTNAIADDSWRYDDKRMAEAWRMFVSKGEVDESVVRPEIARSWKRCKMAGVNPWSSVFPVMDEHLLREKRSRLSQSLEANRPVMHMLLALLQCNVSLMDQENFVFEFFSPLSYYPRTFGTYVREDEVGTGNATVVAYEKKPIRVEGFEQFRSVSQGYSGVSAPFLDAKGRYFGALNLNDPFGKLPDYALEMCVMGVSMANELFLLQREIWVRLRSLEFFRPMLEVMNRPVLIVDPYGRILEANSPMRGYLPDIDSYGYGEQSVEAYLEKGFSAKKLLGAPFEDSLEVCFKGSRQGASRSLNCIHRNTVQFKNGMRFIVLVFDGEMDDEKGSKPMDDARGSKKNISSRVIDYVGESREWKSVDHVVDRIAPINANALILGETGTGKELVARAIHRRSGRAGNFVAINCGAIPRDLFAAELFGYESGAFTGAREEGSLGKIEAANHGTILLDEIGEMPLDLQVGLLRVIQEQSITRLGSTESKPLDVRFLAATNQDLTALIDARAFRSDLYFRLSAIEVRLPPLRKRVEDIPILIEYFNETLSESLRLPFSPFREEIKQVLSRYTWPGNVRELRNVVERSMILAGEGSRVTTLDLPVHIVNARSMGERFCPPESRGLSGRSVSHGDAVRSEELGGRSVLAPAELVERERIAKVLLEHNGNLSKSAIALGISRTTLYKRMERFHMKIRVEVEYEDE